MRRLRRLGPFALLLAAAGCVPGSSPAFDNDPLFNGPRLPRNGTAAAAARPAAPVMGTVQLPPPAGTVSPAALAAAVPAADASALRIGPAPATPTSAGHDVGPWQSVGATLQQPQPLVGPPPHPVDDVAPPAAAAPPPVPPVAASAPPAAPSVYEQLEDELARRGVLFQSLEGPDDHGLWSFTCGVPRRGHSDAVHRVEVSAAGDHGLAAMRAAINQIDKDAP